MNVKSALFFASRLFLPKTARTSCGNRSVLGAVACIAISIVPLIVVLSVADGMIGGMSERLSGLSSGDVQTFIDRKADVVQSAASLTEFARGILTVPGVESTFAEVSCSALAAGKDFRTGVQIRAVSSDIFELNKNFSRFFDVKAGSVKDFSLFEDSAVIGEKTSETLNLLPGDKIRLITMRITQNGAVVPSYKTFTVCAVVSSGYQELDALWVFIPLKAAFPFVPASAANFSVIINSSNRSYKSLLALKRDLNQNQDYFFTQTYTWKEVNQERVELFESTRVLLVFVMVLIVLVAVVNISAAVVMVVMERKKEIAILKSMGATNEGIALSFIALGGAAGLSGSVIGLPLGIICALNANPLIMLTERIVNAVSKCFFVLTGGDSSSYEAIKLLDPAYYLTKIEVHISLPEVFIILLGVLVLSVIVSVIPAVKAGREQPLNVFRKS